MPANSTGSCQENSVVFKALHRRGASTLPVPHHQQSHHCCPCPEEQASGASPTFTLSLQHLLLPSPQQRRQRIPLEQLLCSVILARIETWLPANLSLGVGAGRVRQTLTTGSSTEVSDCNRHTAGSPSPAGEVGWLHLEEEYQVSLSF